MPRSEEEGTRLLSWTLLRFRRLVETFVPPEDVKQKEDFTLLCLCCTSFIIWDFSTYLCYKLGYRFLQKVCVKEKEKETADVSEC